MVAVFLIGFHLEHEMRSFSVTLSHCLWMSAYWLLADSIVAGDTEQISARDVGGLRHVLRGGPVGSVALGTGSIPICGIIIVVVSH